MKPVEQNLLGNTLDQDNCLGIIHFAWIILCDKQKWLQEKSHSSFSRETVQKVDLERNWQMAEEN